MASVTTPATIDRDSQVGAPYPITGATSPHKWQGIRPQSSDNTKTFGHDPPKVFLQFATPHPEGERWRVSDISCVQVVQWC